MSARGGAPDTGLGVLVVWNDVDPAHEDEFNDWYQRQHVPQRLGVPGFLDARRYMAGSGSPKYCAFYRLDAVSVLATPVYREILAHPTRWTQRNMRWFRGVARSTCVVTLDQGAGVGGMLGWIAIRSTASQRPLLRERLADVFGRMRADPMIVRLQLWENDAAVSGLGNPEEALRGGPDQVADAVVTIEGGTAACIEQAAGLATSALTDASAGTVAQRGGPYQLLWHARAGEKPPQAADPDFA